MRGGVPQKLVNLLATLHQSTKYVVRTAEGDSRVYTLNRGLREGCPSSCTAFNLGHNENLKAIKRALKEDGLNAGGLTKIVGDLLPESKAEENMVLLEMTLSLLCFADDTTAVTRYPSVKSTEALVQ